MKIPGYQLADLATTGFIGNLFGLEKRDTLNELLTILGCGASIIAVTLIIAAFFKPPNNDDY